MWEEIKRQLTEDGHESVWILGDKVEQALFQEKVEEEEEENTETVLLAKKSKEVRKKDMDAGDRAGFKKSDLAEWDSLIKTEAVRVLTGRRARRVRLQHAERILRSRFVRTKKPDKYKSRWCIIGFGDPDLTEVDRETPTVNTNSVLLGLQAIASHGFTLGLGDINSAFLQGGVLKREGGPHLR